MSTRTNKNTKRLIAIAAIGLLCAAPVFAHVILAQTAVGNVGIVAFVPIPGMTSGVFANAAGARFLVTFSAECAVNAAAGNTTAYTDVDIQVLNAAGAVVSTLMPTAGNQDSFCSADGVAGFGSWSSNSITGIGGAGLPAGNYRIRMMARKSATAIQAWYGERTLVISR